MSGTYVEGGNVFVPDRAGTPRPIATGYVRTLAEIAKNSDHEQAMHGCDWFDRDALIGAAELVESIDQCAHEDKWTRCDNPAEPDLSQPRPRCPEHKIEVR